jgi:dihydroorotase (multifunctional complex type)
MDAVDLVIKGGTVYSSTGHLRADVAVRGERIVAIGTEGEMPPAKATIDAKGKCVLPGLWHVHCHFREPGHTYKEDFESGTRAAAAGGIAFCIDMTNNDPHPTTLETFSMKRELVEKKAHVDFALYGGGLYTKAVADLAKAGAVGIKIFNTRHVKEVYPYISELGVVDHGILYELYEAVADTGLVTAVHHDDSEWCKRLTFRDYINIGRTDNRAYMECYEKGYMYGHGMAAGLAASLYFARLAKVRLHVLHLGVMPVGAYDLMRHAKKDLGGRLTAELETAALLMTRAQAEKVGPYAYLWAHSPEPGWQSLKDGVADMLVGEHAPHSREDVEPGWQDNFSVPLGITGAQEFIPLLLTQVNEGRLTLEDVVRFCAENPARTFGFFPRKGMVQVGADADFTIVDMSKTAVLTASDMHSKAGHTSWEGMTVTAMPVYTIVRGKPVMAEGRIVGEPGHGRFHPGIAAAASLR